MADKQLLHELLEQQQEPFHLQSYIADKRSQLKNSSAATTLQIRKRKPVASKTSNFCFFSFHESPDVRNSPLVDFKSALMSPCKSPISPAFLRVPPRTAAILTQAAVRIQKRRPSKMKGEIGVQKFGLFGAFMKRLKNRNKQQNRAIGDKDVKKISENCEAELNDEEIQVWSNRLNRRDSERCTYDQSDEINDQHSLFSPFRFSLHRSSPSSGRRTPDFCSPAASPSRHLKQEKSNSQTRNSDNEDEKEHCSPVSVLDSFFDNGEDHNDDLESSYANVQRVKQQLLYRLRRFEKLAELDPMELEKRFLESYSDEECQLESLAVSEDNIYDEETILPCSKEQSVELIQVFKLSNLKDISSDKKRICSSRGNEVWGRISKKLESWKEVEFIDKMVEVDLKNECRGWRKFSEEVEEATEEVELAIVGVLVEEALEGMCCMDNE